jgi:hypothetical protein
VSEWLSGWADISDIFWAFWGTYSKCLVALIGCMFEYPNRYLIISYRSISIQILFISVYIPEIHSRWPFNSISNIHRISVLRIHGFPLVYSYGYLHYGRTRSGGAAGRSGGAVVLLSAVERRAVGAAARSGGAAERLSTLSPPVFLSG